jgi:hypothetical protein
MGSSAEKVAMRMNPQSDEDVLTICSNSVKDSAARLLSLLDELVEPRSAFPRLWMLYYWE